MSVDTNLAILREQLTLAEAKSRELMAQYIENRQKAYEALSQINPDSKATRDAKERLKKAERDLKKFEAKIAALHVERTALLNLPPVEPRLRHSARGET